jgi:hypothetical protein
MSSWSRFLTGLTGFCLALTGWAGSLSILPPDTRGWLVLQSPGETNRIQILEASTDLTTWTQAAVFHEGAFDFADVTAPTNVTRYFRVVSRVRHANDDGRNQLALPNDPFVVQEYSDIGEPAIGWVKFAILRGDETRVWFQDSNRHPFHYDFARLRLPPFLGMSRAVFDQQTLHASNQVAVLGAVLVPGTASGEIGIQFVGRDPYPREQVGRWLQLVQAAVRAPVGTRSFYVPTSEQIATAQTHRDWFAAADFEVTTADRWLSEDAVYSVGWALGKLVYVPGPQIAAAYATGQLRPQDILLTDAVPAEVPFLAGIIALTPATPNSHVAILAQGWEVPFVWFASAETRARLLTLVGREIALRTDRTFFTEATVIDVEGRMPESVRSGLLSLKAQPRLNYTPRQSLGVIATNVQELRPDAIRYVGGKAANYGLLRRTLPQNSEPAIALTFDLWEAFLGQTLPNGRTLAAEIQEQLGQFTYPPDFALVRTRLDSLRNTIRQTARFTPDQQAAIIGALTASGFDGSRKIRFRSSTNVEDSDDFTGAGLYDSFSGCLLDDLDGDSSGPSACDPLEPNERGVFRAIQRVYASFFNENAFLERLRRGVNEAEVGMAVLVHHSYPDEIEMANGVATLDWQRSFGSVSMNGTLVTQLGAVSVTNPDGASRPEVVDFYRSFGSTFLAPRQSSGLVPLGGHVMRWETDYQELVRLLVNVATGYAAQFPALTSFTLDLEYKRVVPGTLDVKQVRRLPKPVPTPSVPYLMPATGDWCVEEGEFSDVFAKHRLKSTFNLRSDPRQLTDANLATPIYSGDRLETRVGNESVTLTGPMSGWPEFLHTRTGDFTRDSWTIGAGNHRRRLTLETQLLRNVTPPRAPWVITEDFQLTLIAQYARPQPSLGWTGPTTTTNDTVRLVPCPAIGPDALPQFRSFPAGNGIVVETRFMWPATPRGPIAGYTAPNIGFVETRISGLTTTPLLLRNRASQTYSPGHHNFTETFLFEPALDPGVSPAQLAELETAQIQQLIVDGDFSETRFWVVDAAGKLRALR